MQKDTKDVISQANTPKEREMGSLTDIALLLEEKIFLKKQLIRVWEL